MTSITVVINPRSAEVSVYAGHMQDAELRDIAELMSEGHPFDLHQSLPNLWHLHIHQLNNLHLIITHTHLLGELHGQPQTDPPATT